jgi:hypothetical protein
MNIQLLSRIFIALLWLSTFAVALCWLLWKDAPFDPEPITVVLGLISTAVTALLNEFGSRLQKEEFSLSYALAYGYVNNFVEPLISQLLRDHPEKQKAPRLYIYMPEKLSELDPKNIDRVISRMRLSNFRDNAINLKFQEGRARDVLTVSKSDDELVYFDFPNTLLTLNSLLDYKLESKPGQFTDSAKEQMAKQYIERFREVVRKLIDSKDLNQYVFFADKELAFEFN